MTLLNSEGQASKLDKANLPNGSKGLVHLDLEALRKSKLGSTMLNWTQAKEGKERVTRPIDVTL